MIQQGHSNKKLSYKKKNHFIDKKNNEINIKMLNNLSIKKIDKKKFPVIKILEKLPEKNSLFETALVSSNDYLVNLYLNKKIKYNEISYILLKIMNSKEIKLLRKKYPKNINDILKIKDYVHSKFSI